MNVSIVCAPFPMSFDVAENLGRMMELLDRCDAHDVVVFPEASLSGYSDDIAFLTEIDEQQVTQGLDILHAMAREKTLHVFAGACRQDDKGWRNQAYSSRPPENARCTTRPT